MKPRPLKIAAAVLAALGVAGVTVGIALLRSGFLDRAIRPLSWTTWGYIVLGAVLYGLAAVCAGVAGGRPRRPCAAAFPGPLRGVGFHIACTSPVHPSC